jgi:Major Facilitator Superfamily
VAAILFGAWAIVELRVREPLLDPRLFGIPVLRAASLGMLVMFFGSYGLFYLNASLLQYGRGYTALQAGVGIVPLTIPLPIAGRYVPALIARIGVAATLAAAFLLTSIGLYGLAGTVNAPYPLYACWLLVFGMGLALAVPCLTAEITTALPHDQVGVGAGLQSTTRELGSALGVAVIGTVTTSHFVERLPAGARIAGHLPHTVADALSAVDPGLHRAVIDAFTSGSAAALRIASLTVLLTGALIAAQILWSNRRGTTNSALPHPGEPQTAETAEIGGAP